MLRSPPPTASTLHNIKGGLREYKEKHFQTISIGPMSELEQANLQQSGRKRPKGRQTAQDALEKLKEIAEYETQTQHKPMTIFKPSTILHEEKGNIVNFDPCSSHFILFLIIHKLSVVYLL